MADSSGTAPEDQGVQGTPAVRVAETWPRYLRRISGGATQAQIATRIGIGRLSVCNWLQGKTQPKAETVMLVARAYDRSPVEALIAASYLQAEEVRLPIERRSSPTDLGAEELAAEVRRRMVALQVLQSAGQNTTV